MRALALISCLLFVGCNGDSGSVQATSDTQRQRRVAEALIPKMEPTDCGRDANAGPAMTPGVGPIKPPAKVIVFAGQSNMIGFGYRPKLTAVPDLSKVAVWTGSRWEQYAVPLCFGPEVTFLTAYLADHPNETIGFIKIAYGDSSMLEWRPDWVAREARYRAIGSLFVTLVETWHVSGEIPVESIVWAQGETDAAESNLWPYYEDRINRFIFELRTRMGFVPFVFSETQFESAPYISVIQSAQAALDYRGPAERICMAPTGDIPTYADGEVHYTTEGQQLVGERLYRRWKNC